jgi:hypothetical protein
MLVRCGVAAFVSLMVLSSAAFADVKVGKVGKVFKGPEGLEVDIVPIEGSSDQFLIRFLEIGGEFEGKVFQHQSSAAGAGGTGIDYKMKYNGADYASVVGRTSWGSERNYEVYAPNLHNGAAIKYDEAASKALKTSDVASAFEKQNKKK